MEREHTITWHNIAEDKADLPESDEFCLIYVNTVFSGEYLTDALYDKEQRVWFTSNDEGGIEGVYGIDEVLAWTPWGKLMWDRYV